MSTVMMVCQRDYTLRTKLGHTIKFIAGEPTPVPETAYAEAISKNIVAARPKEGEKPYFALAHAEITGSLRDALIFEAMVEIIARNDIEDFAGGGVPKAAAITKAIGITVSAKEVAKYHDVYKQVLAENGELPTHPQVEVVKELQSLATRKQMEEFASDHSIRLPETKGKSLKEVKALLLEQVVNRQTIGAVDSTDYVKPSTLEQD